MYVVFPPHGIGVFYTLLLTVALYYYISLFFKIQNINIVLLYIHVGSTVSPAQLTTGSPLPAIGIKTKASHGLC